MLKRGWMLALRAPIVVATIRICHGGGVRLANADVALGAGAYAAAATGDLKLWASNVSFLLIGAKLLAFAIQYVVFRQTIFSRVRAAASRRHLRRFGRQEIGSARKMRYMIGRVCGISGPFRFCEPMREESSEWPSTETESHHEHADGRAQRDASLKSSGGTPDRHAGADGNRRRFSTAR